MTTFVAMVETGSFTTTADLLALPKPRVSVSDPEHHLSIRLLQHTARALSLTEDRRAYFAKCQIILQDIHGPEGALMQATPSLRMSPQQLAEQHHTF